MTDAAEPRFRRRIEDFDCANCGAHIAGNGYTNHCPRCLWSRHVDINPGDRSNSCAALMQPIAVIASPKGWRIVHQCQGCGQQRTVKAAVDDDAAALQDVARRAAENPPDLAQPSRRKRRR